MKENKWNVPFISSTGEDLNKPGTAGGGGGGNGIPVHPKKICENTQKYPKFIIHTAVWKTKENSYHFLKKNLFGFLLEECFLKFVSFLKFQSNIAFFWTVKSWFIIIHVAVYVVDELMLVTVKFL